MIDNQTKEYERRIAELTGINKALTEQVEACRKLISGKEKLLADINNKERREPDMPDLYESMYRVKPLAMLQIDLRTGLLIDVNEAFVSLMGYTRDEVIGKTSAEVGYWIDSEERERYIDKSIREGQLAEYEVLVKKKNGELITALLNSIVIQYSGGKMLLTMAQDISRLRDAERSFGTIFEESPFGMTLYDSKAVKFIDVNKRFLEMSGLDREEIIGKSVRDMNFVSPADIESAGAVYKRDGRIYNIEMSFARKDGEKLFVLFSAYPVISKYRSVFVTVINDITLRRQAEDALRESEEKYSMLFSSSPDFISVSDMETGMFYEANEGMRDLFGYSRDEMVGRTVSDLDMWVNPVDRARVLEEIRKNGRCLGFSIKFRGKDGRIFDATISSKAVDFGGKKCMINIVRDMTEKVKLEQQLRHSMRMEAIGKLAGGVAHDFNNILTGIMGHAELAQLKMEEDSPIAGNLDMIMNLSNKAAQLNQSLLAFSRKQALNREVVRLKDIIRRSEKFLKRLIGEDIEFSVMVKDDAMVNVDSLQIEQVIMNMVVNARDAMPKGGRLTISTYIVEVDETAAQRNELEKAGQYICISFSDTGVGMPAEVVDQIFEPFFTTKEVGKGTGLGLSMAYGNIRQHGGFIAVYSEVGTGTEFRVFLPVVQGLSKKEEKIERIEPPGGSETILLAEDDKVVRELSAMTLRGKGYSVIEAADGEEAARLFRENVGNIDLVILDVIMPKMNGREVFDAIRHVRPSVKVVFVSGYTADYIRDRADLGHDTEVAFKPISPSKLLLTVRETLDRR
jgi:PAS domain S-box-containing protein